MSDSVRPLRRQATRIPCPWDFPGKDTGVGCHFLLQCVKVKSLSRVQLLVTPCSAAYQALRSMGFSRQEYWSGVPLALVVNKLPVSAGEARDEGSIPEGEHINLPQYFYLEDPMDRGAWWAIVHRVTKCQT